MEIHIACDHRGFELKQRLAAYLTGLGHEVVDHGCQGTESCDYPDHAYLAARGVAKNRSSLGVVICSNGIGVSMAANKVPGVRAALCTSTAMASQSRRHNDANVLALGADNLSAEDNHAILEVWLATEFEGGRHARRVTKLTDGECRS